MKWIPFLWLVAVGSPQIEPCTPALTFVPSPYATVQSCNIEKIEGTLLTVEGGLRIRLWGVETDGKPKHRLLAKAMLEHLRSRSQDGRVAVACIIHGADGMDLLGHCFVRLPVMDRGRFDMNLIDLNALLVSIGAAADCPALSDGEFDVHPVNEPEPFDLPDYCKVEKP